MGYIVDSLAKSNVRRGNLNQLLATHDAPRVFFCVYINNAYLMANCAYTDSMVALLGQSSDWLDSSNSSISTPDNVTALTERGNSGGDSLTKLLEIIIMMAIPTPTQIKFLFLSVNRTDSKAKPCRLEITAVNEQEARAQYSSDYALYFAGQIPLPNTRGNAQ
ncbi:host cell division inhibitor Icd-like protein [Proteus mirabilis]|uniref:host cell division inhibitor Icd-like protein n=1 Tax=Proteus mirabilis TaxID=584 RepID=UPI000CEC7588|nr:host cell division inhibitor Icd-like protein [Proteus mirabilis]MDU1885529.1 host cell division inhibitor Icd-like protein [Proteus mirabilis]ROD47788.1 host cell division inhibitor Icd-like protein [Proteus mirabilis]HCT6312237.1 host cell division inhibitor Icd-like protein [Proteus mirabilis]HCZ8849159.1 host cell division inhibitor Icd-like protein [Proteus mirabilis]HEI8689080.1 host cell division inhibitor Icd-like protein [Proteus mirabilis]